MTFKKSQIWPFRPWKMTFRAIQPNLSFDMWFMSPKRSFMPKKRKSYWSVSEIDPSPPQSWRTDRQTDRRTDGRTDRRTTDKSVLEKLRCLSAGGAKNGKACATWWYYNLTPNVITIHVITYEHILCICILYSEIFLPFNIEFFHWQRDTFLTGIKLWVSPHHIIKKYKYIHK